MKILTVIKESATSMRLLQANKPKWGEAQKKLVHYLSAMLLLTGCATVISGTSQIITLKAVNQANNELLEGVSCTITDGGGGLYLVQSNPGQVSINKGRAPLTPNCKKDGYKQLTYSVGDSFNALTVINVLFWPGFIVDAVTGSYKTYPSYIAVMMEATK